MIKNGINEFKYIPDEWLISENKLYTFCPVNREDLILSLVLEDVSNIFYIDIGSNDPSDDSVTKLFHEKDNASGINIEPQRTLYERSVRERKRDINLCIGVGNVFERKILFENGGLSTLVKENVTWEKDTQYEIDIVTLKSICDKYIGDGRIIHFLKIDVEGYEREVLEGADFVLYRPWIIVIEAVYPNTRISCCDLWEDILIKAGYHCAYSYEANRYYVANEKAELDGKFISMDEIEAQYDIFNVKG